MANQKLKTARMLKHWSITVASEHVGVDRVTYSRWERGEQVPHPTTLSLLCQAFDASPEELGFDLPLPGASQGQQIIRLTSEQLTVLQGVLGEKNMAYFDPAKRETLRQIAVAIGAMMVGSQSIADNEPWERLVAASTKAPGALNSEALDRFEHLIVEAWKLSNINELEAAEIVLSSFLPRVIMVAQQGNNARVAHLASQGLRLQSILTHHRLRLTDKISMCQQSVEYARLGDNPNTLVAALLELAVAHKYNGQYDKWFQVMQEALYHATQATPLLQSQAYFKNALAFAFHQRKREADLYIQMGFETFPDQPELDSGYAFADSNIYTLSRDAGRVQVELGHVPEAYNAFAIYQSSTNPIPERLRLEIVNAQGRAAILENDLEKYAFFLKDGLSGALALGSKKRFDEARTTFREETPGSWRSDRKLQDIAEQYRLENA
jgi:transcriptional regulator with XRE-family HTH domain